MIASKELLKASGYLLAPVTILLMWMDLYGESAYLMVLLFFVLLPLARLLWPLDIIHGVDEVAAPLFLRVMLRWLPTFFGAAWIISAVMLPFGVFIEEASALQLLGQWVSVWIASSLALAACHELIHRSGLESLLGRCMSASLGHFAFLEEHRMHHIKSGRGRDPDCASRDESVYAFAVRSGLDALSGAWEYELAQQIKKGRARWSNAIVWTGALTACFGSLWWYAHGYAGLIFYGSMVLATVFSLRALTFIQHWGLQDVPLRTGGLGTSWVSACAFQSWVTFNLALHECHHRSPGRSYWKLNSDEDDLRLPVTYPLAFLLSLVPGLYRRVMGPRLDLWIDGVSAGRVVEQPEVCLIR